MPILPSVEVCQSLALTIVLAIDKGSRDTELHVPSDDPTQDEALASVHAVDGLGGGAEEPHAPEAALSDMSKIHTRSGRAVRPTSRYPQLVCKVLPEGPAPVVQEAPQTVAPVILRTHLQLTSNVFLRLTRTIHTLENTFGLSRVYLGEVASAPDEDTSIIEQRKLLPHQL